MRRPRVQGAIRSICDSSARDGERVPSLRQDWCNISTTDSSRTGDSTPPRARSPRPGACPACAPARRACASAIPDLDSRPRPRAIARALPAARTPRPGPGSMLRRTTTYSSPPLEHHHITSRTHSRNAALRRAKQSRGQWFRQSSPRAQIRGEALRKNHSQGALRTPPPARGRACISPPARAIIMRALAKPRFFGCTSSLAHAEPSWPGRPKAETRPSTSSIRFTIKTRITTGARTSLSSDAIHVCFAG
jgi:hypothetical protein